MNGFVFFPRLLHFIIDVAVFLSLPLLSLFAPRVLGDGGIRTLFYLVSCSNPDPEGYRADGSRVQSEVFPVRRG